MKTGNCSHAGGQESAKGPIGNNSIVVVYLVGVRTCRALREVVWVPPGRASSRHRWVYRGGKEPAGGPQAQRGLTMATEARTADAGFLARGSEVFMVVYPSRGRGVRSRSRELELSQWLKGTGRIDPHGCWKSLYQKADGSCVLNAVISGTQQQHFYRQRRATPCEVGSGVPS